MKYYLEKNIILDHIHHSFCSECKDKEIDLKFKIINHIYINYLLKIINLSFKKILKKDNNPEPKKIIEKKIPLSFNFLEDSTLKKICGFHNKELGEISNIIKISILELFEFLTLMKQGISQTFSSVCFSKSQMTIQKNIHKIINNFEEFFLKDNIGYSAFNRDQIIKFNTPFIFPAFFPDIRGLIDSTYFYIEKNKDFEIQKKTFCLQKERNLIKEMVIILPNENFFDFLGPFFFRL